MEEREKSTVIKIIQYVFQVLCLYIIIITAIINLTISDKDRNLWISLLGASLGFLLPCPKFKIKKL